jgi:hypothetical protein
MAVYESVEIWRASQKGGGKAGPMVVEIPYDETRDVSAVGLVDEQFYAVGTGATADPLNVVPPTIETF